MAPPHCLVGRLELPDARARIEQRRGPHIGQLGAPERLQGFRIESPGDRPLPIRRWRTGDSLGEACRGQQACRDPRREVLAGTGQHRQPGGERIAGGGHRIEDQGIEEQIRQRKAGEVAISVLERRENQPIRRNSPERRLPAKIPDRDRISAGEPDDAARARP